jgi:hypothetical protein
VAVEIRRNDSRIAGSYRRSGLVPAAILAMILVVVPLKTSIVDNNPLLAAFTYHRVPQSVAALDSPADGRMVNANDPSKLPN